MNRMTRWRDEAPSNIALIKYMGKDGQGNQAANPSLSYTLPHLRTEVELRVSTLEEDSWEPLRGNSDEIVNLGPKEIKRFLDHLTFLKKEFKIDQKFTVLSRNNFPRNCGLASSASSFAALTRCAYQAFRDLAASDEVGDLELAGLSRVGSGSSCRSFLAPWCLWIGDEVQALDFGYKSMIHQVVVVESGLKKISSSDAHQRVNTSLLYQGRNERARMRLGLLIDAFGSKNWSQAFEICWAEFWDMHALFETASPSFGYMNSNTLVILDHLKKLWKNIGDGPIVTMDAGPNVHLLFRQDQSQMAQDLKIKFENKGFKVFDDDIRD